jgi:hypothetical protein
MIAVTKVEPIEDYKLILTFNNGEIKVFEVKPYLNHGIFEQLVKPEIFKSVKVSFDSIEWVNGADICPEVLYNESRPAILA